MMKYTVVFMIILLSACSAEAPHPYTLINSKVTRPEWKQGELLKLTGIIWPSTAHTKFYIDTIDGRSALLKGDVLNNLKPGTKISLNGRVECVNGYGSAGASDVMHSETYLYINVSDFKILDEAAWDVENQFAVDKNKTGYSLRE